MIGVKDINNKDIPNNGRYNIHPTPESLLNCYREYAQRNGDPFKFYASGDPRDIRKPLFSYL